MLSNVYAAAMVRSCAAVKPSIITFPPLTFPFSGQNVAPGATSTNNETPIVYASSNPAVATVTADGLLHIIGAGVSMITATQAGNANYSAATPVSVQLTITTEQFINFPGFSTKFICDDDFAVGATSYTPLLPPSTIPLIYTSSDPTVATVSANGIIHILTTGVTNITVSQAGDGIYFAAPSQTQTVRVVIPDIPVVNLVADHNSVCLGTPVTFTATVTNVGANDNLFYLWQVNGVNADNNNVNTSNNGKNFTWTLSASTDIVKCTVTDYTKCGVMGSGHASIEVDTYIAPSVSIKPVADAPVCLNTAITFTATPINGGASPTYQWQVNGVNAGSNSSTFTSSTLRYQDKITCIITNNDTGCLTIKTAVSNMLTPDLVPIADPLPSVIITASSNNVKAGTPVTFTATAVNTGTISTYQWQVNGSGVGTNSATYIAANLHEGDIVSCIVFFSPGCTPTVTSNRITMQIIPGPVVIVNTFTPNGDGINDTWNIPSLIDYPNCFVSIFNRNGSLIYQSKGYRKAWDGTYKGSQLPVSTYYYIIDIGTRSKLSGEVTIVK